MTPPRRCGYITFKPVPPGSKGILGGHFFEAAASRIKKKFLKKTIWVQTCARSLFLSGAAAPPPEPLSRHNLKCAPHRWRNCP